MSEQESSPIPTQTPEAIKSFESQYPGIFALRVLPEVESMQATPHQDGSFDLTVVSADGYTLIYQLRKPNEHDFNGDVQSQRDAIKENYLTIEGMKLTHSKGTIDIVPLLHQAEERIVNGHKNTYLIAASKPKHLPQLPQQYLARDNYSPDSVAEPQIAADIIRTNVYMDEARFDQTTNSLRSRLPVGDLSLYTFIHEATHSLNMNSQNNTLEPYANHPRLQPIYSKAHQLTEEIKRMEAAYSELDELVRIMETEKPDNPELDALYTQLFNLKKEPYPLHNKHRDLLMYADREQKILSERDGHVPTVREAKSFQRNMGLSRNRLKRIQMFERFVLYTYQKHLEEKREEYPLPNLDSKNFVHIPEDKRPFYDDILLKVTGFTKDTT